MGLQPRSAQPATWSHARQLAKVLDSLDKANPALFKGYRIQIYFGNLQEARSIRAQFRRDHPDTPCQLMPIDPNYAVTVGNYRDVERPSAPLEEGTVGQWKHALVIPSDIDLPALALNELQAFLARKRAPIGCPFSLTAFGQESVLQRLLHFHFFVSLDDVADFDVVESLDVQATFEALGHFFGVVLESLERSQAPV